MYNQELDENKIYYVYEWIRLDTLEPFYVGKGKNRRAYDMINRNHYFNKLIQELDEKNIGYAVSILHDNLSEKEALEYEVWYIHVYDFEYGFDLVNITWGGDGTVKVNYSGPNRLPFNYSKELKKTDIEKYQIRKNRKDERVEYNNKIKEEKKKEIIKEREEKAILKSYYINESKYIKRIKHNAELMNYDIEKLNSLLLKLDDISEIEDREIYLNKIFEMVKPPCATFGMKGKEQSDYQKERVRDGNKKSFCILFSDNHKEVYNSRTEATEILHNRYERFNEGIFKKFLQERIKVEVEPNYYIVGIYRLTNKKGETLINLDDINFDGNLDEFRTYKKASRPVKVIFKNGEEKLFKTVNECSNYMHENYDVSSHIIDKLLKSGEVLNSLPRYYNLYKLNGLRVEYIEEK